MAAWCSARTQSKRKKFAVSANGLKLFPSDKYHLIVSNQWWLLSKIRGFRAIFPENHKWTCFWRNRSAEFCSRWLRIRQVGGENGVFGQALFLNQAIRSGGQSGFNTATVDGFNGQKYQKILQFVRRIQVWSAILNNAGQGGGCGSIWAFLTSQSKLQRWTTHT